MPESLGFLSLREYSMDFQKGINEIQQRVTFAIGRFRGRQAVFAAVLHPGRTRG